MEECQGCIPGEAWCALQCPAQECSPQKCPKADHAGLILVIVILAVCLLATTFVLFFARTKLNRIFSDPRNVIVSEISNAGTGGKGEHQRNIGAHMVVDNSPMIKDLQKEQQTSPTISPEDNDRNLRALESEDGGGAILEPESPHVIDITKNTSDDGKAAASTGEGSSSNELPSQSSAHSAHSEASQGESADGSTAKRPHTPPSAKLEAKDSGFQSMHGNKSNRRASIGETIMRRLSVAGGPTAAAEPNSWEISVKDLKFRKKIGEGGYGTIYLGEWLGTEVAIKTVKQALCKRETFLNEVQIMSTLHHPNIVIFMGASLSEKNICMVMEYMEKGDMQQFLKNKDNKPLISMHLMHRFAIDIARGMKYLHHRVKMIQRDLKSDNLLIDGNYNCKICDFGLTRYIDTDGHMTACGTPYWTAPEVIRQEVFDHKADVFSYGIVLWELLTQKEPYGGMEGIKVAYAVADSGLRPNIPSVCPEGWDELMQECWHDNPEFRPDFGVILDRLVELKKDYENIDFVSSGDDNKTSLGAHRKSVVKVSNKH